MESKAFYKSKSFWLNTIALGALVIQSYTAFVIDPKAQASILIIVNLILRAITGEAINFGGKVFIKK